MMMMWLLSNNLGLCDSRMASRWCRIGGSEQHDVCSPSPTGSPRSDEAHDPAQDEKSDQRQRWYFGQAGDGR